ncbi:MAG: glycosyltransferase family 39 protein [Candidatus Saganbacteria bacterium]|nr:glycosyltransferase family 39 protein [Candidatus Saganbacteria bacterium]
MAMWLDHGQLLYKDLIDLKPPLLFYLYLWIFKLFGWSALSLRWFSLFYSLAGTVAVFLIGRKLSADKLGLLAAALFAVFSGGPRIEGAGANAEVFMLLPMMLGLLFFLYQDKWGSRALLLAGLFSGAAIMIKQVALFNFLALAGFLVFESLQPHNKLWGIKKMAYLLLGCFVVPFLFAIYFLSKGALVYLIEAALFYGLRNIGPNVGFFAQRTLGIMLTENSFIWLLALAGSVHLWAAKKSFEQKYLVFWTAASFLGVYVGGYAFGHYYIQLIPGLCFLSALSLYYWRELGRSNLFRWSLTGLVVVLCVIVLSFQYKFYLVYSPDEVSMAKYNSPVNTIARDLGEKLRQETGPDDLIFPRLLYQLPLYSGRLSASKCYLSLGGSYLMDVADGLVLRRDFRTRQKMSLIRKELADFDRSLKDPRTKYVIYLRSAAPPDFAQVLRGSGYRYDEELSYPGPGVIVYKRVY